jgi:K+-transporting ATPase ATPase C chain
MGRAAFRHQADGSLVTGPDGKVIGSRLIAQPFSSDEYFQPRPSATTPAYNASASGASNWAASQPLLRDRVARQLGPIVKYRSGDRKGQPVGPAVEAWFRTRQPDYVAQWAKDHPAVAEQWIKDNVGPVAAWLGQTEDDVKAATGDTAKHFFPKFAAKHPGTWPSIAEEKTPEGQSVKRIQPSREGSDVQAYLFDPWLGEHPDAQLESVPADMVMASASGLDPQITLKNAQYQLDRMAAAWAKKANVDEAAARRAIEDLLREKQHSAMGGWIGVPLINVLEVNLELRGRIDRLPSVGPR